MMSNPFQDARELQHRAMLREHRGRVLQFPDPPDDYLVTPKAIMFGIILGCAAWGVIMLGLFFIFR